MHQERRKRFEDISQRMGSWDTVKQSLRERIRSEYCAVLEVSQFPETLRALLDKVVGSACKWNNCIRSGLVDHLYQPFIPEVGSVYDDRRCTPYFPYDHHGGERAAVAAVVSLGLEISDLKATPNSLFFVVEKKKRACVMLRHVI